MKAYISVSFSKRRSLGNEVAAIAKTLNMFGITAFVFVDHYTFNPGQEQEMMAKAMAHINDCDILIAETSEKGVGIGVEAGYAKAKNKTVIYVRHKDKEHSTTISGISDFRIFYNDINDLEKQLAAILTKINQPG